MPRGADLIVANRAYADHHDPAGEDSLAAGAGGLVAAVSSAIEPWDGERGTLWIGAGRGEFDRDFVDERGREVLPTPRGPLYHQRLFFEEATWRGHYEATSNSFFWPALHLVRDGLPERAAFFPRPKVPAPADWEAYERANLAFARAAAESGRSMGWIHDYQLALVPRLLREAGFDGRIGFFLHTPFPAVGPDAEGREEMAAFARGILGADLAGFQTARDRRNFLAFAASLPDVEVEGDGLRVDGRSVQTGAFPVGVNADDVRAASGGPLPDGARQARQGGLPLVVGLERADFTKGVPERLRALAAAWREGARFAYYGSSSPTRQGIALYDGFAAVIEREAAAAAVAAERAGCPFVHEDTSLSWPEVVALLAAADVVFTSSLADGMNLVPLQAAVAQEARDRRGLAVAGLDAGVAHAYADFVGRGLAVVDPLDVAGTARILREAVEGHLAGMTDAFVEAVNERDASHWAAAFMAALEETDAQH